MIKETWFILHADEEASGRPHFAGRTTDQDEADKFLRDQFAQNDQTSAYVMRVTDDSVLHLDTLLLNSEHLIHLSDNADEPKQDDHGVNQNNDTGSESGC